MAAQHLVANLNVIPGIEELAPLKGLIAHILRMGMERWMIMPRILGVVFGLFALGVILVIGTIAMLAWLQPDHVTLPRPTGPYTVGRTSFDWVDGKHMDPFAPEPDTKRELIAWIWYPAKQGDGKKSAEHLPKPIRDAFRPADSPIARVVYFFMKFLTTDRANVQCHSIEDASLLPGSETFPIVLLKPGRGAFVLQYASLAEDLASNGYVVVGSDSPYTTPVVVYQDGRVARRSAAGAPSENSPGRKSELAPGQPNDLQLPILNEWARDESFLLDMLQEINAADPSGRFTGRLNLQAVGAFGHSLGGAAALQFCQNDEGCKAGVNIDGAPLGEVVRTGISKPFLSLFSDRPIFKRSAAKLQPDARALMDFLGRLKSSVPNKHSQLILLGSAHWDFCDQGLLTEAHLAKFFGQVGPIGQERALAVTRRYIRAFFDTYLKSRPDKLLEMQSAEFPEMRFE
jgi:predicted dienelactone hydrolase